jgi:hypothetical protein
MCCIHSYTTTSANNNGPQRSLGIYVGFESPSIIKYLEPLTGDLHTAQFADSIFNEEHFPALGGGKYLARDECREITWESTGVLEWTLALKKMNLKFRI